MDNKVTINGKEIPVIQATTKTIIKQRNQDTKFA